MKGSSIRNSSSRARASTRVPANFRSDRIFLASKIGSNDLSAELKKEFEYGRHRENWVCAVSKNEPFAINGRASLHERSSNGDSPSLGSVHPSYNEVESNNNLRRMGRTGQQAMEVLDRQLQREVLFTYTSLIDAACREGGVEQAMKFLHEMRSKGCEPDLVTYSALINGMCNEGRLDDAIVFLNSMPSFGCQPDTVTHNIVLRGLCNTGRRMDAEKLLSDMLRKGCSPDVGTFNILINFLCKARLLGEAVDMLEKMQKYGCTPITSSYNPLLHAFCKEGKLERAIEYLNMMVSRGCSPDIVTYKILLTA